MACHKLNMQLKNPTKKTKHEIVNPRQTKHARN